MADAASGVATALARAVAGRLATLNGGELVCQDEPHGPRFTLVLSQP